MQPTWILGALEELKVTDVHALGEDVKGHVQFPLLKLLGWYLQSIRKEGGPGLLRGDHPQCQWRSRVRWRGREEKVAAGTWAVSVTGQRTEGGHSFIHATNSFLKSSLMWAISKTFIEIVMILLMFYVLFLLV